MSAIAAKIRRYREQHPDEYCHVCLWRVKTAQGVALAPCPKHAATEPERSHQQAMRTLGLARTPV